MINMHRREQLRALEEDLGYLFDDAELLDLALIHKSYANEEGIPDQHNERLEFLGDSVLDLAVAGVLYELEPQLDEGDMTRVRAFLVKEDTLARAARALDLGGAILLGKGEQQSGGEDKSSILANAFEALVGAVYLDGGFGLAYNLVESIFAPVIDEGGTSVIARDYKTRLQEYCQARYKKAPTYRQVESTGPDHNRVFVVEVLVDKRCLERGRGHSKKEAEQNAARHALEILE